MKLNNLKFAFGSIKSKKRVGRGEGSGIGGTSKRGHKGAKSRSGYFRWGPNGNPTTRRRACIPSGTLQTSSLVSIRYRLWDRPGFPGIYRAPERESGRPISGIMH